MEEGSLYRRLISLSDVELTEQIQILFSKFSEFGERSVFDSFIYILDADHTPLIDNLIPFRLDLLGSHVEISRRTISQVKS
jgi:hypothetical protein